MDICKHYYERLQEISPPRFGPYFDFEKLCRRQRTELEQLRAKCIKKLNKVIEFGEKNLWQGEIFVSSPWEAWVILWELHRSILNIDNKPAKTPLHFFMPAYRGQANGDDKLVPSLYREHTDQEFERECFNIFSFIFNQKFLWKTKSITLPLGGAKAAAQHYGIKTALLDISADPQIAIHFASCSRSRKKGEKSSVFMCDLSTFMLSGFDLILPHPIVKRIYCQRGAFIEVEEPNVEKLQHAFHLKISFPFDSNFSLNNILSSDPWFEKAISWSKQWVKSGEKFPSTEAEKNDLLKTAFEKIGYPANFYDKESNIFLKWIQEFEEMMGWYAMRIKNGSQGWLSGMCQLVARSNPELINLLIIFYDNILNKSTPPNEKSFNLAGVAQSREVWINALAQSLKKIPVKAGEVFI